MTASTSTAPVGDPPGEPGSRPSRGRHRGHCTRRTVATGTALLAIVVGAGFAVADLVSGAGPQDSAPTAALAPEGPGPGVGSRSGPEGAGKHPRGEEARGFAGTGVPVVTLPGLGPKTRARIPDGARQVVIASGDDTDSPTGRVTLWTRAEDGFWRPGATWRAHNGLRGWSREHRVGDLRSPVGVFSLSDAGGLERDPGTKLPYHRSGGFAIGGTGFRGEPLEGTFDHVVAIDYNREPGTSPLDGAKPLGPGRGGGIWLHVDHGGPTQGCVTMAQKHLVTLMRALEPGDSPVIVMGDRKSLER